MNDSKRFISMIQYFNNEPDAVFYKCEIIRPAEFILPLMLYRLTPVSVIWSIIIFNIIFHFLTVLVLYKFILLYVSDESAAFFSAMFYAFSPAVFETGFYAVLVDSGSHLFFLLPIYLFKLAQIRKSKKLFVTACIILLFSLLFKQSAMIVFVWICLELLLNGEYKKLLCVIILVGLIYAGSQLYINQKYDYNIFDFQSRKNNHQGYNTVKRLVTYGFITFNLGWIFFLYGLNIYRDNKPLLRLFIMSTVFVLSWLFHPRFFIFLFPVFYVACAAGIKKIRFKKIKYLILIIYPIVNTVFYFLIRLYGYDAMRKIILK